MTDHHSPDKQCRALIVNYHGDIDRGRASAAIRYFDEDAEFEARGERLRGREQILRFLTDREAQTARHTVHVVANPVTVESSDDAVEISALIMLHVRNHEGGYALERVLDTRHRFRSTPSGYNIVSRRSTPIHPAVPIT
jgi:hypothetical protein